MTTLGSSGVKSPDPEKHRVAGGRITVTFGSPPCCSQVPVHWAAVSGPQPAVSGRKPLPEPGNCGPVVVVPLPGVPALGGVHTPLTHKALEQSAPVVQGEPFAPPPTLGLPELPPPPAPFAPPEPTLPSGPPLVPVPHTPFVHAPLAHSEGVAQLEPSGRPEPPAHVPFVHVPLAHCALSVHAPPAGTPWPLPAHVPFWHTPLVQSALVVQVLPPGWPLLHFPLEQSPLAHELLLAQLLPAGRLLPAPAGFPESPDEPQE